MRKALINIETNECENIIVVDEGYEAPEGYRLEDVSNRPYKAKREPKKVKHNGVDYTFDDFKEWLASISEN